MKKYVQHISGQGEKWEVEYLEHDYPHLWRVKDHQDKNPYSNSCAWLPKSEYRLCDPPEEWEDVTGEYQTLGYTEITSIPLGPRCRFKLIDGLHNGPCFIVERKKS